MSGVDSLLYAGWYAKRFLAVVLRGSAQRANNWAIAAGGILGFFLELVGFKVTFAEGWAGALVSGFTGIGVAWVLVFLFQAARAPFRLWKDGQWHGNKFIYNEPKLALSGYVSPEHNNKAHCFRFLDAPPDSVIDYEFEFDAGTAKKYIALDVGCTPAQLTKFTDWNQRSYTSGAIRVNSKRDMCFAAFMKDDVCPFSVRIKVKGWEY
jgi:hypothetical protein